MREDAFRAAPEPRGARFRRLALAGILAMAIAAPALAQSFLGTIRGTVTDPQGAAVPKASVLIVDQSTGVPRPVETDAQGRYEAANLRPGTYRIEVVTTNFKKAERTGIILIASGTALADVKLEIGSVSETVTVSAEANNNITLESQAVAVGLDAQQLRDLPRNSRDIQDFLLLNPNVVGGSDDIQFLGGRTYGVSLHPGRADLDQRDLRHRRATPLPASTRSRSSRCSRTPTAPSTAGSPGSWSPPSAAATTTVAPPSTTSTRTT